MFAQGGPAKPVPAGVNVAAAAQGNVPQIPAQIPGSNGVSDPNAIIKVYLVNHATPADLMSIINTLIPGVQVIAGPQPHYVRETPTGEALGVETNNGPPQPVVIQPTRDPKVVADQFVRQLIFKGLPADIERVMALLKEIDVPSPQVLIEAKIVDLSTGVSSQLGITWDFAPNGTTGNFKLDTPVRKGSYDSVVFGRLSRGPINFNATLEAAISNNQARLLATPRLLVLYNHRAQIFIGDEVTYLLGSQSSINGSTLQTGKVKVGVELNVVAIANPDGTINLKVNPEVGSLLQLNTLANGVSLPQISRRTVNTSVRVKDGETLIIGGLIGENEIKTLRKVPILGDLPILGHLFRREGVNKNKSELVIFLKATIIREPENGTGS